VIVLEGIMASGLLKTFCTGALLGMLSLTEGVMKEDASAWPADAGQTTSFSRVPLVSNRGGILWQASDGEFTLADLAQRTAPVLELSPDEPLFRRGIRGPQPMIGEAVVWPNVVYYAVRRLVLTRSRDPAEPRALHEWFGIKWSFGPVRTHGAEAIRIQEVVIRYFLYYPEDYGPFHGHLHDLEGVDVHIGSTSTHDGLRVTRVAASAHGVSWFTNELSIDEDTDVVIPPHVFIERGKHATAPDRDANGVYKNGYDVNRFIRDSWGVRDMLGHRLLPVGQFSPSMFTRRSAADVSAPLSSPSHVAGASTYALVPSSDLLVCQAARTVETLPRPLVGFARYMQLCMTDPVVEFKAERKNPLVRAAQILFPVNSDAYQGRPFSPYFFANQSVRVDGASVQLATLSPLLRVPRLDGWLSVRTSQTLGKRVQASLQSSDMLYSQSVAQLADWYAGVGYEEALRKRSGRAAAELGLKLSVPFPGDQKWLPPFVTARLGVRSSTFDHVRDTRFVWQLGFGAW
jgi:hypothetical protein